MEWCGNVPPDTPDSGNNNVRVYGYSYDAANNLTGKTRTVTSPASSDAWAYTYDNANQQLSVSMNGGTAETRTYDAWGRMATRTQGTSSATFGYRYGGKLYSYATNFAGEAAETMQYQGDMRLYLGKVKTGTDPSALRSAWVSPGFYGNAINEEDGTGALTASSVYAPGAEVGERLAYMYGALSNGLAAYAYHDQLGSTRAWRWFTKALAGRNEFAPYGEKISGYDSLPRDYALHVQDPYTLCYHAPYRKYAAGWARWTTRDPMAMVDGPNMYAYVGDGPIKRMDSMGLSALPMDNPGNELPHVNPSLNPNPSDCCLAKGDKATKEASDKYPWDGSRTWQDHMRHCTASCELRKSAGWACAVLFDFREYAGMIKPESWQGKYISDGDPFDLESNSLGRGCANSAGSCDACCREKFRSRAFEHKD